MLIITLVALAIYLLGHMMDMLLLTFVLTYLVNRLHKLITKGLGKFVHVGEKSAAVLIYIIILLLIGGAVYSIIPKILGQGQEILFQIKAFSRGFQENGQNKGELDNNIMNAIQYFKDNAGLYNYVKDYSMEIIRFAADWGRMLLTGIGRWSIYVLAALMLSFFFIMEKKEVYSFMRSFKSSKLGSWYDEIYGYYRIFIDSFGKIIEAQVIMAVINTVLTGIGLLFLGIPNVIFLSVIVFILSLIPYVGTILSLVPLSLIAFKVGGPFRVIYLMAVILIIHGIGSYFIFPKLIAERVKLPIFITLIVLLVSDYLMGTWGLIFGLPVFVFALEIIRNGQAKNGV